MNEFDQFIKHSLKIKHYARYTDDFVIIAEDKKYLEELLPKLQTFLSEDLHLDLHPKKISIRKFSDGIDFLGYVIFPKHILIRAKTKKRIIRKTRTKMNQYHQGFVSKNHMVHSMQSYLGVFSHANAHGLTEKLKNKFWFWLNN